MRLLLLLAENHSFTVAEICDKIGISRRNFYYYLEFFRDSGFHVFKRGTCYCVGRDSPFFDHLVSRISFTEEEAVLMRRLLDGMGRGNVLAANLRKKLDNFYDFKILAGEEPREQSAVNIRTLYDAIKLKRQVVLCGYASPHSGTTRDRFVEPFMLMNSNNEVRCFEPASGMNKTFKVSRMQGVKMLETQWACEAMHREMFTDVFMFSGERLMPVEAMLGQLSYNVLIEEYPRAAASVTPEGCRHRLRLDVCSYAGIGRFVLGLFDDIEVLGDEAFKDYLRSRISRMRLP